MLLWVQEAKDATDSCGFWMPLEMRMRTWLNASCLRIAEPLQNDRTIEGACRARGLKNSPTQEQPEHEDLIKRYTPIEKLSSPPSTPYKGAGG